MTEVKEPDIFDHWCPTCEAEVKECCKSMVSGTHYKNGYFHRARLDMLQEGRRNTGWWGFSA